MSKSDAEKALDKLGAKRAKGFRKYARTGDISAVECLLCHHSPCQCKQCPVEYRGSACGFTVPPGGKCPRGH